MERPILGVGQLLAGLSGLFEHHVGRVLVMGEISNLHLARSGHAYFTLKDADGQIRAALFRGSATRLRFALEEGLEVVVEAEVSIYATRGDLQLIVRGVEPRGVGALQLAFEQLRRRLEAEGLFDPASKRAIPVHPRRIGVVTSPSGAALRDVLEVTAQRFPGIPILISPCLVQGDAAPGEIVAALARIARFEDVDVVLLVRGGGSLEDLQAFNSEVVARALRTSRIPVIAGVGHETDVTIADLVADARAATPSAAAMLATPDRAALARVVERDRRRLLGLVAGRIERARGRLAHDLEALSARSPSARVERARSREARARAAIETAILRQLERSRRRFVEGAARLDALSPLGVLARGYALVRRARDGRIVRSALDVAPAERLDIRLAEGRLVARVEASDRDPA
ncbi:MAG: exodeoxyribonuclease VII large subunit [Deltaproteobacteria bacterium]|nr:exodeoxyribonuclease VII large subunit [Deltaproteobacteria bacterium]